MTIRRITEDIERHRATLANARHVKYELRDAATNVILASTLLDLSTNEDPGYNQASMNLIGSLIQAKVSMPQDYTIRKFILL